MILPRMVKGDDVWITVLILVVRLLALLSSELIQAGGSSVERKRFSENIFAKLFSSGGLERVVCHCAWGGAVVREEVYFKPTVT